VAVPVPLERVRVLTGTGPGTAKNTRGLPVSITRMVAEPRLSSETVLVISEPEVVDLPTASGSIVVVESSVYVVYVEEGTIAEPRVSTDKLSFSNEPAAAHKPASGKSIVVDESEVEGSNGASCSGEEVADGGSAVAGGSAACVKDGSPDESLLADRLAVGVPTAGKQVIGHDIDCADNILMSDTAESGLPPDDFMKGVMDGEESAHGSLPLDPGIGSSHPISNLSTPLDIKMEELDN
jgi:hypothetical protein